MKTLPTYIVTGKNPENGTANVLCDFNDGLATTYTLHALSDDELAALDNMTSHDIQGLLDNATETTRGFCPSPFKGEIESEINVALSGRAYFRLLDEYKSRYDFDGIGDIRRDIDNETLTGLECNGRTYLHHEGYCWLIDTESGKVYDDEDDVRNIIEG